VQEHDVENRAVDFGWPSRSKPLESITFRVLDESSSSIIVIVAAGL